VIDVQSYVNAMVEPVDAMKITDKQKDFVRAAFRASIEYANAMHGMHASKEAREAAHQSARSSAGSEQRTSNPQVAGSTPAGRTIPPADRATSENMEKTDGNI
jgi:hypothetical protein